MRWTKGLQLYAAIPCGAWFRRRVSERTRTGDVMAYLRVATGDRIIDPMITLAGCSMQHRIVVAGSKSMELMLELHRRRFLRAAATGNCGRPAG